jgi:hypothetical protein
MCADSRPVWQAMRHCAAVSGDPCQHAASGPKPICAAGSAAGSVAAIQFT